MPGLTAGMVYLHGDNIDTVNAQWRAANGASEWERDLTVAYVVQEGPLKNLGLMWKNATWRTDLPDTRPGRKPPDRQLLDPAVVIALA